MESARQELHLIFSDREVRDVIILVFANKQDLPDAANHQEILEKLVWTRILNRNWFVYPSCVSSRDRLHEGLSESLLTPNPSEHSPPVPHCQGENSKLLPSIATAFIASFSYHFLFL
ncbi:ADP-ribosylation factor 6 [Fukomys damarensis]|uniref:ADP-ribosylation factor 6 n=1 Tax=Fukomys damarensis TaxID=885580 RepID=A0A091CRB0_FUKDA|nr:ADP-ribosylation factor 6 [Fukomys damarensis]